MSFFHLTLAIAMIANVRQTCMYLFLVVILSFLNINVFVFINFDVASDNSCSEAQLRSQLVAALPLGSVDNLIYYYSGSNLSRNRIKTN